MLEKDLPFPMPKDALMSVDSLPYPLVAKGKVREVFDMGDAYLMVATDRVSAFDVIMTEGLAGKGDTSDPNQFVLVRSSLEPNATPPL